MSIRCIALTCKLAWDVDFTNIKSNRNMSRSDWKCSAVHEYRLNQSKWTLSGMPHVLVVECLSGKPYKRGNFGFRYLDYFLHSCVVRRSALCLPQGGRIGCPVTLPNDQLPLKSKQILWRCMASGILASIDSCHGLYLPHWVTHICIGNLTIIGSE